MPHYDYECPKCQEIQEIFHMMSDTTIFHCNICHSKLNKLISTNSYVITKGLNGTIEDHKESEHTKKVKDPERAIKLRKRMLGNDAVGNPSMKTDPRHIIKRGKTLGGQNIEVDKKEFVKQTAKSDYIVDIAKKALKKAEKKK